ncbi:MAG: PEGA domain-containing protein [Candidatus Beckwithbacteria bacterium]|nr:PEGA domain-containing protein [Candidatus Beckwithbacteria bacterium]
MRRIPRLLIVICIIALLTAGTIFAIRLAKGYRPSFITKKMEGTGLLAANSTPRGATVFINDKLTTATDTTLNLPPKDYKIKIAKDGYIPWEKTLKLEPELVTQTNTRLFPAVPNLTPLTFSGAINPIPSPDGQKIVFSVNNATTDAKNGLYILDLFDRPFALNSDPRQISRTSTKIDLVNARLAWSPDSNQVLATINAGKTDELNVLLNTNSFNDISQVKDVSAQLPVILKDWNDTLDKKDQELIKTLPVFMQTVATASANFVFSPDAEKIMYVPDQTITIPDNLIPQLPASSTQKQTRQLQPANIYIYDLLEDRNFWLTNAWQSSPTPTPNPKIKAVPPKIDPVAELTKRYSPIALSSIKWYPDSRHVIVINDSLPAQAGKIIITEYDATNADTVYAGPFSANFAYPWPNGSRLIILTSLNGGSDLPPNLYSINLK